MNNTFTPLLETEKESLPVFLPLILGSDFDCSDFLTEFEGAKEIDLARLENAQPELAYRLRNYWLKARSFFDTLATGESPVDYSLYHRLISFDLQDTRKGSKVDLISTLKEIDSDPLLKEIISPLLDQELFQEFSHPYLVSKEIDGLNAKYIIDIPGKKDYSYYLGGLASRAEIGRFFQLTVSYAKWRDRRVRKLISVETYAKEIWPNE